MLSQEAKDKLDALVGVFGLRCEVLMDVKRKDNGKRVALLCGVRAMPDGGTQVVPYAELIEGNPNEIYEDPAPPENDEEDESK